ncbi:HAD-IA family hydrolase [Streptomyces sp. B22F1]|uniref:HAD-IA family hydrolase n=1 Tax=unclassified Streptomyces TaxID=2593676 RepID=UPI000AFEA41B
MGAHAPLATISNSQRDIIDVSVRKLGDPFTYVFTGEAVGAYKPHRALFELVLGRAGVEPHEAVHVAQSQYRRRSRWGRGAESGEAGPAPARRRLSVASDTVARRPAAAANGEGGQP